MFCFDSNNESDPSSEYSPSMDTVHNQDVFPLRESNSIMSGNGKGFTLENLLEVHSLNSDQVFFSIQSKTFSKFSGWTFKFFAFKLYHSLFQYL